MKQSWSYPYLRRFRRPTQVGVVGVAMLVLSVASAGPISIENSSQIFRDYIGPNPLSCTPVDAMAFSAKVNGVDAAIPGNTVTATSTVNNAVVNLPFDPSPAIPNEFGTFRPFDPIAFPTGDWVIRAENGVDFVERISPGIGNAGPLPLVENTMLAGDGTLSWTIPATSEFFNVVRIDILAGPNGIPAGDPRFPGFPGGVPPGRILDQTPGFNPLITTSINIKEPSNFKGGLQLRDGDNLVVRIRLENFDATRRDALGPIGTEVNRSSTFVSFVVSSAGTPPVVVPTVCTGGVFNFNVPVQQGVPIVIDPAIAVGYDYKIQTGNPRFRSVRILTDAGDGRYDLILFHGQHVVRKRELLTRELYTFHGRGVSAFRIAGIEASAGLDPTNTTAFLTEVTFAGDGQFTGTMTPITVKEHAKHERDHDELPGGEKEPGEDRP